MRIYLAFFLSTIVFGSTVSLTAQIKPPPVRNEEDEVIKIETELIEVPLVVTDRSGKPIVNLNKTNFTVYEDGKPQAITDFSTTSAPFEVALLLDTSGSTLADLPLIKRAAQNFISSLRPGDRVSIISYRAQREKGKPAAVTEVISRLTSDRNSLNSALDGMQGSFGTPYYDSLVQVAESVFRDEPTEQFRGRRAMVALTDGVDSTSITDFEEAKELLEKTGIAAYFVKLDTREFFEENLLGDCASSKHFSQSQIRRYYKKFTPGSNIEKVVNFCDLGDFERLAISKKLYEMADAEMNILAKGSGGKVFPVADLSEARTAFKQVADEIGRKYSLGYYSSNEKRDGSFRRIRVEIKAAPAGAIVRAREGYTAPAN